MLSSNPSTLTTAWLAFAIGAVTLLGLALLALMYVFSSGPLGTLNDICNSLAAILSVALAGMLYSQQHARNPQLATASLILVISGAVLAVIGSWLVMSGRTGFFLAGMFTMTGYALIGAWLFALNYGGAWPRGLVILGLVSGAVMLLGLAAIPSIFLRIDSFSTATWHTWLGQAGFLGWAILYPIWCLRLWHVLRAG